MQNEHFHSATCNLTMTPDPPYVPEDFPYDDDPMPGMLADERNLDFPLEKATDLPRRQEWRGFRFSEGGVMSLDFWCL